MSRRRSSRRRSSASSSSSSSSSSLIQSILQRREEGQGSGGNTGPPAQRRARATYENHVSVTLLLSASESAAAPASPIWLNSRLQRGEESRGCSSRDRAASTEQGARDLLERRQRRVALERLRERRGARLADPVVLKAAAKRGGSGMLVARQCRRHRTGRARLTRGGTRRGRHRLSRPRRPLAP